MKLKLKPCPFCGGRAEYDYNDARSCSSDPPGGVRYIICAECEAGIHRWQHSPSVMAELWNRRYGGSPIIEWAEDAGDTGGAAALTEDFLSDAEPLKFSPEELQQASACDEGGCK